MPLDNTAEQLAALEKRLEANEKLHRELYVEHKTLLDDFARLRGQHGDLLGLMRRMYPPDSTIGLAIARLGQGRK